MDCLLLKLGFQLRNPPKQLFFSAVSLTHMPLRPLACSYHANLLHRLCHGLLKIWKPPGTLLSQDSQLQLLMYTVDGTVQLPYTGSNAPRQRLALCAAPPQEYATAARHDRAPTLDEVGAVFNAG